MVYLVFTTTVLAFLAAALPQEGLASRITLWGLAACLVVMLLIAIVGSVSVC